MNNDHGANFFIELATWQSYLVGWISPPLSYKEVKNYLNDFVDDHESEEWDDHKEFYKKYPFIEKNYLYFLNFGNLSYNL